MQTSYALFCGQDSGNGTFHLAFFVFSITDMPSYVSSNKAILNLKHASMALSKSGLQANQHYAELAFRT